MTMPEMKTTPIPILGLAHIGIRVHDLERSVRFYELLGFTKTAGPIGPEPVAILDHPSGVEVNLVLKAQNASEPNILMDVPCSRPCSSKRTRIHAAPYGTLHSTVFQTRREATRAVLSGPVALVRLQHIAIARGSG